MIEDNVKRILTRLEAGNGRGEKVTLVAATKTRTPEEINRAIRAGIGDVGENRVGEFREKYDLIEGARRHFIGRLQRNKVKYLIGKVDLIHSLDREELAVELSRQSVRAGVATDVLVQVNIGNEESKGGFALSEAENAYRSVSSMGGLNVRGFMAMLPISEDGGYLSSLCDRMRELFERTRARDGKIEYLSMGMSSDWELCLEHGANMIRLGTAIFGERNRI